MRPEGKLPVEVISRGKGQGGPAVAASQYPTQPHHLRADAGCKGKSARKAVVDRNYQSHIKQRKEETEEKRTRSGWKTRRWVVERTHSWFNRYRKLLISFEKAEASYKGLLALAAALICCRQTINIYG
jgi:transposase